MKAFMPLTNTVCQPWPAISTEVYCISLEAHLLQRAFPVDGQEVDVGLLCGQQEAQGSASVANVPLQQCMEVLGKQSGAVSSGAVSEPGATAQGPLGSPPVSIGEMQ